MSTVSQPSRTGGLDLSAYLTAAQIDEIAAIQAELAVIGASRHSTARDRRNRMLERTWRCIADNITGYILRDVEPPGGLAFIDVWEGDEPTRFFLGGDRGISGHPAVVQTAGIQRADGHVKGTEITVVDADQCGMTAEQARQLAAALVEAAAEVDGWAAK